MPNDNRTPAAQDIEAMVGSMIDAALKGKKTPESDGGAAPLTAADVHAMIDQKMALGPKSVLSMLSLRERAPAAASGASEKEMREKAPLYLLVSTMVGKCHAAQGVNAPVSAWVEHCYGKDASDYLAKTHQLTDYTTGGALSQPDFASYIISGLDNMTVVRRMSPTVLDVPGSLVIPSEDSAPDASAYAENGAVTPGEFGFGDIRIDPKRMAIQVVLSNALLRNARIGQSAIRNIETYIVRRMRELLAFKEDANFLTGDGTSNKVLGLQYQIASTNQTSMTTSSNATREASIREMKTKILEANIVPRALFILASPATVAKLETMRDTNGNLVYPTLSAQGTIYGSTVITSNQIADTAMWMFDGPSILVANQDDAAVRISTEGSYEHSGGARSLISRDETLVHLELYSDVKLERSRAGVIMDSVAFSH